MQLGRTGPLPQRALPRFSRVQLQKLRKPRAARAPGRAKYAASPTCFLRLSTASNKKIEEFGFAQNMREVYEIGECIGAGSFSTVHEAIHKTTGEKFAVKTIQKRFENGYLDKNLVARVHHEVDIYQHLGVSLNIAYLYGVYETDQNVEMVMELCTGGQLTDRISKRGMREGDAKLVIRQILRSVAQCHAKNVVMRDVKPDNFLFLDNSRKSAVKAVDFGLADYCSKDDILSERCGTPVYIAPEVLRRRYGQESDLWSVGVIAYQVLTGQLPFAGENGFSIDDLQQQNPNFTNKEIFRAVLYSDLDFHSSRWTKISREGREVVEGLLCRDIESRMTAEEALAHTWLSQVEADEGDQESLTDSCIQRLQRFGTYGQLKQATLRRLTHQVVRDTDLMKDLQGAFCTMDTSGEGKLGRMDILTLLASDRFLLSQEEIRQLAAQMEMDEDGSIDFNEWLAVMADWREVQKSPQWKGWVMEAFSWFDMNENGWLGSEELTKVLCGNVCEFPDIVPAALREADIDGDGELHFSEFAALMWTDTHDKIEIFGSRRRR